MTTSTVPALLTWVRALPSDNHQAEYDGFTTLTLLASKNNLNALVAVLAHIEPTRYASLLNHPDAYGNTAVHYFALAGNGPALHLLAMMGSSFTLCNNANQTPHNVCTSGTLKCEVDEPGTSA